MGLAPEILSIWHFIKALIEITRYQQVYVSARLSNCSMPAFFPEGNHEDYIDRRSRDLRDWSTDS